MSQVSVLTDDGSERRFKDEFPLIWWGTLLGPFVLSALIVLALYFLNGPAFAYKLLGTVVVTFFFFGRFVILSGNEPEMTEIQAFFSPEFLFSMVVYMDTMVATLFLFHSSFLFKIPKVGAMLSAIADDGRFILRRHPWINRAAFLGLTLFVAFPLAATGSVGGAILSRILGMNKTKAFFSLVAGSVLGCGIMYFGAQVINTYLARDNPIVTIGGIVIVAVIIILLNLWYRRLKRREAEWNVDVD